MQDGLYNVMVEVDDATINDGKCQLFFSDYPSSQVKDKMEADLQESLDYVDYYYVSHVHFHIVMDVVFSISTESNKARTRT